MRSAALNLLYTAATRRTYFWGRDGQIGRCVPGYGSGHQSPFFNMIYDGFGQAQLARRGHVLDLVPFFESAQCGNAAAILQDNCICGSLRAQE